MTTMEALTLLAILLAPLLAFSAQWALQFFREKRERKIWIFRTLMSTRATILSPDHVKALNLIDLEFGGDAKKDRDVRDAWHTYHNHLLTARTDDTAKQALWDKEAKDLLNRILFSMSNRLGFGFEYSQIQKGGYVPDYYSLAEIDQFFIRKGLLSVLTGQAPLKMDVQSFPMDDKVLEAQKRQLELSIEYLEGKRPLPVTVVGKDESKATPSGAEESSLLLPPAASTSSGEGGSG
jgi:hypothetical protein